jgi:hypothetical protein
MKRLALFPVLLICAAGFVCSFDFGLFLSQELEAENNQFSYTPALIPWVSWNGGKKLSFYISNKFFFDYYKYKDNEAASGWARPVFRSELTFTALDFHINEKMFLQAGRIEYADALEFAALGLFDGARFEMNLPLGVISAGAFYTGFLYKETALILMTANDAEKYAKSWYHNIGAYFASRRFLSAVRWDIPLGEIFTLSPEVLAQFDLNDDDQNLHSQYVEIKMVFYPLNTMEVTAGALFEAMQSGGENFYGAFGFLAGMKMDVPGPLNDQLNATFKFTSGPRGDDSMAFTPLSCLSQGDVFPGTISALAFPSAGYRVRIHYTLFAEGSLRYFIRTYDDSTTDGNLYGGEMWASLAWQPLEDIRLTVGGGVFFPGLGNVYPEGTDPGWKVNAVLTLSL